MFSLKLLGFGFFCEPSLFHGHTDFNVQRMVHVYAQLNCHELRVLFLKLFLSCPVGIVVWMLLFSSISCMLGPLAEPPFLG